MTDMPETMAMDATPDYVGFWWRVLAYIVDIIIVTLILFGISTAAGLDTLLTIDVTDPSQLQALSQQAPYLDLLLYIVYFLGFWTWKQATPGKMLIGARIALASDSGKPNIGNLAGRLVLFILPSAAAAILPAVAVIFGIAFIVSCIWVAIDENKQGLHDKIGRTVVIKKS